MAQNYLDAVAQAERRAAEAKAQALKELAGTCRTYVKRLMEEGYTGRLDLLSGPWDRYGYFIFENGKPYHFLSGASMTGRDQIYEITPEKLPFDIAGEEQLLKTARQLEKILEK
ncbi:MAG: hypothetical protein HYW22_01670 [Candidatus Aenigmarchaeota archaeon]|nr:hypothetical protein [Candidatus Aenigmarchaeota archaeon]